MKILCFVIVLAIAGVLHIYMNWWYRLFYSANIVLYLTFIFAMLLITAP